MKRGKDIFVNRRGEKRLVWLLALALAAHFACVQGAAALYYWMYGRMMAIWGVTSANVTRAPGAVQALYRYSTVIVTLLQSALLLAAARGLNALSDVRGKQSARGLGRGLLLGVAGVTLIWTALLLTGSVRMGWRLSRPAFSANTAALLLTSALTAAGEGYFLYGAMMPLLLRRARKPWMAFAGVVATGVIFSALEGNAQPVMLANAALMTLMGALLCPEGNVAPAAGFCLAWRYMDRAVLGFAGSAAALYETYPVNMYWLNGGHMGLDASVMATALLVGMVAVLLYAGGYIRKGAR